MFFQDSSIDRFITHALGAFVVASALVAVWLAGAARAEPPEARADLATRFRVNDQDPRASTPSEAERNQDPVEFGYWLQDMLDRAEGARERGDWEAVVKYYGALKQAVPQQVTSYQRLCHAYRQLGHSGPALENCAAALAMKGVQVQDHLRFLDTLLGQPSLTARDIEDAKASLAHLREHARLHPQTLPGHAAAAMSVQSAEEMTPEQRKADPQKWLRLKAQEAIERSAGRPGPETSGDAIHLPTQIEIFSCRLGVRTGDAERLATCTQNLSGYNFPPKLIVPFTWAQAIAESDQAKAKEVLVLAQQVGVPESARTLMRDEQARIFGAQGAPAALRPRVLLPVIGAAFLLALVALALLRRFRARGASAT